MQLPATSARSDSRWPWKTSRVAAASSTAPLSTQGEPASYTNPPTGTASESPSTEPDSPDPPRDPLKKERDREALGRSRGGLSTKVHLAADGRCRPLGFITTVGQRHDSVAFVPTLATVAVGRNSRGRPRTRPDAVLSDKAYSSQAIRQHLAGRGIKAVIPLKDDQRASRAKKGSAGGRPQHSTLPVTATGTPSSGPSTRCGRTVPSRPASTSATTSTAAPSQSLRSSSGSATPSPTHYGTRPNRTHPA